tara:strand:- start:433 stop:10266 length:9834 start_codon:yes stop_codon:yes gene_type:complete
MPEIKHNFTGGKMNKDLDERLVPKGEYRDAMNIQVSATTEKGGGISSIHMGGTQGYGDIGSITNITGNTLACPDLNMNNVYDMRTVATIADEKNNYLYWFAGSTNSNFDDANGVTILPSDWSQMYTIKDVILRKKIEGNDRYIAINSECEFVFVDKYAFTISNNINASISQLAVSPEVLEAIDIGWTVQGIAAGVNKSNKVNITNIDDGQVLWDYDFQGGNVTSQYYYPQGIFLPLDSRGSGQNWEGQQSTMEPNVVFVRSSALQNSLSSFTGAEIEILPYSGQAPVVPVDTTIISATQVTATYQQSQLSVDMIRLELSNDLITLTNPILESTDPAHEACFTNCTGSGLTGTYDGQYIDIIVKVTNTVTNINPNENLLINPAYISSMGSWSTGDQIDPNWWFPNGGCINYMQMNPTAMITIDDCSGNILTPHWTANQVASPSFSFTNNPLNVIYFDEPLDITTNVNCNCAYQALQFDGPRTLGFSNTIHNDTSSRLITGINIIDDMLFWTDNFSEPKKISIPRSINGTDPSGNISTRIVNSSQGYDPGSNNYTGPIATEEYITVIKKAPKSAVNLNLSSGRDPNLTYAGITTTSVDPVNNNNVNQSSIIRPLNVYDFSNVSVGETIRFEIEVDINNNDDFDLAWKEGDVLLLKEFNEDGTPPSIPLLNYRLRGRITNWQYNSFSSVANDQDPTAPYGNMWPDSAAGTAHVEIEILNVLGVPPQPPYGDSVNDFTLNYAVDLESSDNPIFELKFPRFSYRYKYKDGEYSTFAPWSEIAFLPGNFMFEPKDGYNLGMVNTVTEIELQNFITQDLPKDVVSIDILYKEEKSNNIYLVDTLNQLDDNYIYNGKNAWQANKYKITSETIKATIAPNQLLRSWDNVPRKALAQEVTGNRIVYGNYTQNINLNTADIKYKPKFHSYLTSWEDLNPGNPKKSIKSLRDYKLGVVFTDKYGRETPVLTSESGGFKVNKEQSINSNRLIASLQGQAPDNVEFFKFFIKETSSEYYNLAMDRWYDAEDGNIWLAFPSSDRNKLDIDTTLFLKKGDGNDALENLDKYKILAIESDAPTFVKTKRIRIGSVTHDASKIITQATGNTPAETAQVFGVSGFDLQDAPRVNSNNFILDYNGGQFGKSSLSHLDEIQDDLFIRFVSNTNKSGEYKIAQITSDRDDNTLPTQYYITLEKPLKSDIDFIYDNASSPNKISNGIKIRFVKAKVENSPKFEGRFFVKISNDGKIKANITNENSSIDYIETSSKMVYLLGDDNPNNSLLKEVSSSAIIEEDGTNKITYNYSLDSDYPDSNDKLRPLWARRSYFGQVGLIDTYTGDKGDSDPSDQIPNAISYPDGVWFIDKSIREWSIWPANNTYYYPHLSTQGSVGDLNNIMTHSQSVGNGVQQWSNQSQLNIAFGGFGMKNKDDDWGLDNQFVSQSTLYPQWSLKDNKIETFFGIGEDNPEYNDGLTTDFVSRMNSSFNFRWEDDPSETVYTIIEDVNRFHGLRWPNSDDPGEIIGSKYRRHKKFVACPSSYHKSWGLRVQPKMEWDPSVPVGTPIQNGLKIGKEITTIECSVTQSSNTITVNDSNNLDFVKIGMTVYDAGTPANIKTNNKNIGATIISINYDNGEVLLDEPFLGTTTATDDLDFGYTIRAISSDFTNMKDIYVIVDNIEGACEQWGGRYKLKKGMQLHQYNIDGTPKEPTNIIIKNITQEDFGWKIRLTGYEKIFVPSTDFPGGTAFAEGQRMYFRQVGMNSASNWTEENTDTMQDRWDSTQAGIGAVGYRLSMLEAVEEYDDGGVLPENPFVWETEPKESEGLDLYYEISGNNALFLNAETIQTVLPLGSIVTHGTTSWTSSILNNNFQQNNIIEVDVIDNDIEVGDMLTVTKANGIEFDIKIDAIDNNNNLITINRNLYNSNYKLNWFNCYSFGNGVESNRIRDNFNLPYIFNGVKVSTTLAEEYQEENRKSGLIYSGIYNSTSGTNNLNQFIQAEKITKDLNPTYGSIQKLHSRSSADGDLIALCEDRVLKILANKDALYNADGNVNLVSTNNVLGQAVPYAGEYGISKDPASFASQAYRCYFTDSSRRKVLRLSKDGLTPISDYGMKKYWERAFQNDLGHGGTSPIKGNYVGSYDKTRDEYNITPYLFSETSVGGGGLSATTTYREDVKGWSTFKSYIPEAGDNCNGNYFTFNKGIPWVHTKHSPRNNFYGRFQPSSFTAILNDAPSSIKTFHTLNYEGSQSRVSKLLTYNTYVPGTNLRNTTLVNNDHYNLEDKEGWYVRTIKTNKEEGAVGEFIEKEGKWFNYIKGKTGAVTSLADGTVSSGFDNADSSFQGLGRVTGAVTFNSVYGCTDPNALNYNNIAAYDDGTCIAIIEGCTDPNAANYCQNGCNTDDGTCVYYGCTDPTAFNYDPNANTNDPNNPCEPFVYGCTDSSQDTIPNTNTLYYLYYNYNPQANTDDGSCVPTILGCTQSDQYNYDASADVDDGSCVPYTYGCMDNDASNYWAIDGGTIPAVNTPCNEDNDGAGNNECCTYDGCNAVGATNYNASDPNDGGCEWCNPVSIHTSIGYVNSTTGAGNIQVGWNIPTISNQPGTVLDYTKTILEYAEWDVVGDLAVGSWVATVIADPTITTHTILGLNDQTHYRVRVSMGCDQVSSEWAYGWPTEIPEAIGGCTDANMTNTCTTCNFNDNSCVPFIYGCTDQAANNFCQNNCNTDDGSCTYTVPGCTDNTAMNYDPSATVDDGSCQYPPTNDFIYGCTDLPADFNCGGAYDMQDYYLAKIFHTQSFTDIAANYNVNIPWVDVNGVIDGFGTDTHSLTTNHWLHRGVPASELGLNYNPASTPALSEPPNSNISLELEEIDNTGDNIVSNHDFSEPLITLDANDTWNPNEQGFPFWTRGNGPDPTTDWQDIDPNGEIGLKMCHNCGQGGTWIHQTHGNFDPSFYDEDKKYKLTIHGTYGRKLRVRYGFGDSDGTGSNANGACNGNPGSSYTWEGATAEEITLPAQIILDTTSVANGGVGIGSCGYNRIQIYSSSDSSLPAGTDEAAWIYNISIEEIIPNLADASGADDAIRTYRLYAKSSTQTSSMDRVLAMFGDLNTPYRIETDAQWFNDPTFFSSPTVQWEMINADLVAAAGFPASVYNTWIALGDFYQGEGDDAPTLSSNLTVTSSEILLNDSNTYNGITYPGIGMAVRSLESNDTNFDNNDRYLLAQLSTSGSISGTINLKGTSAYNDPDPLIPAIYTFWQNNQMAIPAPSNDLSDLNSMYGCTDSTDSNYDANAVYNVDSDCAGDGSGNGNF